MKPPFTIKVTLNGKELSLLAFAKDRVVIGRGPDADVFLDNPGVSRDHAVIEMKEGALWIRDLQSSNGTELNGKTVSTSALNDGDLLGIGRFDLRVSALSLVDEAQAQARVLPPLNPTIRTD